MPAFTFEKISPPPRIETPPPVLPARRSRLARLVDRLTDMRSRSDGSDRARQRAVPRKDTSTT